MPHLYCVTSCSGRVVELTPERGFPVSIVQPKDKVGILEVGMFVRDVGTPKADTLEYSKRFNGPWTALHLTENLMEK